MNNLEFALEMKNKRLASGLSQGELASLTHVSRYSINRFENGKANASKETQNIILRCLNYYVCDKPFYLLVDYLSVRFPTTDALEVIRKVLGMKADYFIHYDYGYYGYKEHYAYGEIKVMASDDEHMGVFLELKGAGSRNMEYVLQAQNRDWYSFLNRCLDCGGVIRRFDLAINDMCGLLDIPVLSEKYKNGGAECRCKNYENVQGGKTKRKNRNLANTLYIGSKASTKYFCLVRQFVFAQPFFLQQFVHSFSVGTKIKKTTKTRGKQDEFKRIYRNRGLKGKRENKRRLADAGSQPCKKGFGRKPGRVFSDD